MPIPVWSLSHWYMWLPLGLLVCVPCFFVIGNITKELYRQRRDYNLLKTGAITLYEYRRRRLRDHV